MKQHINSGVILLPGNNYVPMDTSANSYPFVQDNSFLYYTGIDNVAELVLLIDIDNDEEILFGNDVSLEDQIWIGEQNSIADIARGADIDKTYKLNSLHRKIKDILSGGRTVHYLPVYRTDKVMKLSELLNIKFSEVNKSVSKDLISAVVTQRSIKTDEEVKEIEKSLSISHDIYSMLLKNIRAGIYERELTGLIDNIVVSRGCKASFPAILTVNAKIFHKISYNNLLDHGDLLLVDTGVKSRNGYSSDITRTYPVSGKYTEIQKRIYNIVLEAQLKSINNIKPGIKYRDIHLGAGEIIAEGLKDIGIMKGNVKDAVAKGAHSLFFPHGLGHMLGLGGHDMEALGEDYVGYDKNITRSKQFGLGFLRFAKELRAGNVITVEPGIYFIPALIDLWESQGNFKEFINYKEVRKYINFEGIRIEDDVLVTKNGHRVLGKPIPKEISEIETIMNK